MPSVAVIGASSARHKFGNRAVRAYLRQGWLLAKLVLVAGLVAYHVYLVRLKNQLAANRCARSSRWLRVFNEVPALLLIAIVVLVVVKP